MKKIKIVFILMFLPWMLAQCAQAERLSDTLTEANPENTQAAADCIDSDSCADPDDLEPNVDVNAAVPTDADDSGEEVALTPDATTDGVESSSSLSHSDPVVIVPSPEISTTIPSHRGSITFTLAEEADTDGDEIADTDDNCLDVINSDQTDFDEDGEGDVCDYDSDADGDGLATAIDTNDNRVQTWGYVDRINGNTYTTMASENYTTTYDFVPGISAAVLFTNQPSFSSGNPMNGSSHSGSGTHTSRIFVKGIINESQYDGHISNWCSGDDDSNYGICIQTTTRTLWPLENLEFTPPNSHTKSTIPPLILTTQHLFPASP